MLGQAPRAPNQVPRASGVTEPDPNRWNAQGSLQGPWIKCHAPRTSGT